MSAGCVLVLWLVAVGCAGLSGRWARMRTRPTGTCGRVVILHSVSGFRGVLLKKSLMLSARMVLLVSILAGLRGRLVRRVRGLLLARVTGWPARIMTRLCRSRCLIPPRWLRILTRSRTGLPVFRPGFGPVAFLPGSDAWLWDYWGKIC